MRLVPLFCCFLTLAGASRMLQAQMTYQQEGALAYRHGDYERAVTLYEKSLATALKVLKEDDPNLMERRAELGEAYRAAGRWNDAVVQLDYVWRRARYDAESKHHWLGESGDMAMGYAEKLGKSCLAAARYDDGIMVFKTSLADAERSGRVGNALQFGALLADTEFQARKPEEATKTVRHVAELTMKLEGNKPLEGRALQQLAMLCLRQGLPDAAKPLAARALEIALKAYHDDPLALSEYQETLVSAQLASGDLDEAEKVLKAARENVLAKETPESPRMVDIMLDESTLALKRNQAQDALSLAAQALTLSRKRFQDNHFQTGRCLNQMARCQVALNEPAKARPLFSDALVIFSQTLGEDNPQTLEVRQAILKMGPRLNPAKSSASPGPRR